MAIQMIVVGIVLLVTSTFGGYFAYLCRRKAYSRKSANSSTEGSEKSVPVQVGVKTKNAVKIRVSVVSASSSITTEKTYDDSNTDNVSHISTASQSVRSLPEFIPNYVSLDKTVEANRGSIKLASIAFPPLGYTPSEDNSSCVGRHSGIGSSATSSACHSASDNESIGSNNGVVINGLSGQDERRLAVKKLVVGTAHTKTSGTMIKRMSFSSTNSLDSAGPDPIHPMSTGDSMSIDAMPITTAIMMR